MSSTLKCLCVGDVIGDKGVDTVCRYLNKNRDSYDFIIVNIENSNQKGGKGFSKYAYDALSACGVDVFTGGNHSFDNKFTYDLYQNKNLLRPCNFPSTNPGKGHYSFLVAGVRVVVINVQLRVFMRELLSCPFRSLESLLSLYQSDSPIFIIDLHGEATAEKLTFGAFFDGKVSAIFGTHTHVQTADARIMPQGTGYITDVGMVGSHHSSLGIKFEKTIFNFVNQMPILFEIEESSPFVFSAISYTISKETKKCISFERIYDLID
jgi:metallophosphoesterase (TIGR00282 family)